MADAIITNHLDVKPDVKRDWCNRIIVDESLQALSFLGIYVIGDAGHVGEDSHSLPATTFIDA